MLSDLGRRPFVQPDPAPMPAGESKPVFFAGLDLGCLSDYSALAVVERRSVPNPENPGRTQFAFDVRHLHRWQLKTPYPDIVTDVKAMYADGPLSKSTLVIDATGVGVSVVQMFQVARMNARLRPMSITCGSAVTGTTVAKKHLVSAVQAPLCSGRLRFAKGLEFTKALTKELEAFRVTVDQTTRNESFAAWRDSDHDDLVLALALALFIANQPTAFAAVINMG